jgi:TfoX/Sxy family transcriptional regulator of competence genes
MAYNTQLANRIRELIAERTDHVEERKMFGGLAFLVDDKICVAAKADKMLIRIAPELYNQAIEEDGCTPMSRSGKNMTGYLYVDNDYLAAPKQLAHWVNLALDYNPRALATKK